MAMAMGIDRLRCSCRQATVFICALNLIAVIYILHTLVAPRYLATSQLSGRRYSDLEIRRIKESFEARKAVEPHALIRRVKEIQEEAEIEASKNKEIGDARQKAANVLAQRLKELKEVNSQMNQQALEEWRKKKLDSAKKRETNRNL